MEGGREFADGAVGELDHVPAVAVHSVEDGACEDIGRVAQRAVFAAGGGEDDSAVGQVARVHVVGLVVVHPRGSAEEGVVVLLDAGGLIGGRACQLPRLGGAGAGGRIDVDFVDAEPLARGRLPVEDDLARAEMQIESAEDAVFHFGDQVGDLAGGQIEHAQVPAEAPAAVDEVGVEMARVVRLPLDEDQLAEVQLFPPAGGGRAPGRRDGLRPRPPRRRLAPGGGPGRKTGRQQGCTHARWRRDCPVHGSPPLRAGVAVEGIR